MYAIRSYYEVQGPAMQLDQGLGQRQTETGTFVLAGMAAVDLAELGQGLRNA